MIVSAIYSDLGFRASQLRRIATTVSGVGASVRAGRFNRPGRHAVYLSSDVQTAYAEYQQKNPSLPRPCAIVSLALTISNLLDLRSVDATDPAAMQSWRDDWEKCRDNYFGGDLSSDCASWQCSDLALTHRCAGVIYPSTKGTGTNITFYPHDAVYGTLSWTPIDPSREVDELAKAGIY